jgi:hypothetical protein
LLPVLQCPVEYRRGRPSGFGISSCWRTDAFRPLLSLCNNLMFLITMQQCLLT